MYFVERPSCGWYCLDCDDPNLQSNSTHGMEMLKSDQVLGSGGIGQNINLPLSSLPWRSRSRIHHPLPRISSFNAAARIAHRPLPISNHRPPNSTSNTNNPLPREHTVKSPELIPRHSTASIRRHVIPQGNCVLLCGGSSSRRGMLCRTVYNGKAHANKRPPPSLQMLSQACRPTPTAHPDMIA